MIFFLRRLPRAPGSGQRGAFSYGELSLILGGFYG